MDYELERQMAELNYQLADLKLQTGMVTSSLTNMINLQRNAKTASTNNANAHSNNNNGATRFQQIMSEEDKKTQQFNDNLKTAFGHSVNMLTSLGGALVSSTKGLQKYSQTVENFGKGASTLGDNLGLVGLATGGLIGLLTKFASSILNLNQNTLDIRDNFAKAGGIIPTTTVHLGELAKNAGFALDGMKILGDKMAELSESMTSLGGFAGEGAIKFMQIANVEDNIRRQFGRLGVSQEELLNLQGMYLETQRVSGGYIINQNKSVDEIQKESLQYAKTLMQLSSLTGDSVEAIQKEVFAARLEMREQARQHRERTEIARLRREGRGAEADELERQAENRQRVITVLTAMYNKETAMQFATVMETGVITEETSPLAMLIPNVQAMAVGLKHSTDINRDISDTVVKIDNATRRQAQSMVDAITHYPELAEQIGLNLENLLKVNNRTDTTIADIEAILQGKMEGEGENADPLADRIENVREFERDSKKLFQTLLEFIDPFRNFNLAMVAVVGAAAVALTGLVVLKIGRGLVGGLFELGSTMFNPVYIRPAGGSALGLGSAAFAGSAADPTGLGLRKADLVDKNGRPLGGAALDARLRKLSEERLPKTTSFALKQAAKNSAKILKGAATLGSSLVIVSAGLAGATWIMGKAIPTFAAGLKKFNEVDGDNLKGVGLGMAGLGAGILAFAAERIVGFFNTLASAFGADSPLERAAKTLQDFEKINVDPDKIERNGKAVLAFANAFKEMPATTVTMSGMLAGFFSGPDMPYDKFEKFAQFEIDVVKAENNSKAFMSFSNALASYTGYGAIDGLGAVTTAIADSLVQFYKVDPPEKRFKDFSDLVINGEQTKLNAIAFRDFSDAMRQYRGPPGAIAAISSLIGSKINKIFGRDGPVEAFIKFSENTKEINPNVAKNAKAFFDFATAIGMLTGGTSNATGGGILSGIISTVTGWLGGDSGNTTPTPASPGPDGKVLDLIGRVESGNNYNRLVGGQVNPQISNMSVQEVISYQSGMVARGHESTAIGKYQIIKGTLEGRVAAGVVNPADKFNSATQDKLAVSLMDVRGRPSFKQGRITVDQYADNLSKEWASLPYNTGRSYYAGTGSNKSLIQRSELVNALKAKQGGLFSGPSAGYPMELHGTELIVPVTSNSVLMKLATEADTNAEGAISNLTQAQKINPIVNKKPVRTPVFDVKRIETISTMFDKIIDVIDSTDDIDKKILQYSQ